MPETDAETAVETAEKQAKEFHLGLTMSGAISAGAYTAGVFDFLIEALDEWEKARPNGPGAAAVPNHRVGIKVISGASAGAITAAIGAVALADADETPLFFDEEKQRIKCYLPKLYDAWVVKPTLVAETAGATDFLTTTDLAGPAPPDVDDFSRSSDAPRPPEGAARPVTSLLNSRLLDEIARAALEVKAVRRAPRAYISETLHIYLTLTNLRGVPYEVSFEGGDYGMISHGDRVHYAVTGLGGWTTQSAFSDADSARDLSSVWLEDGDRRKPLWHDFTVCALASAAFPVGLAPRHVAATTAEYAGKSASHPKFRRFPNDDLADRGNIQPPWSDAPPDFPFMTADGGTIDNDPFEYARFALKKLTDQGALERRIDPNFDTADRAVIMVSPFPEAKPIRPAGKPAADILSIVSALLPSLIDQARFKPSELVLAADPDYASRYLIGPRRAGADGKLALYPIASGLLGGFGGFVSRKFRDHDFQLGRRNCQRFLQSVLTLPATNPLIRSWPDALPKEKFKGGQPQATAGAAAPDVYCIIPLLGTASAENEVALPVWPRISTGEFETLQKRIAQRFDAVAPAFFQDKFKDSWWLRAGLAFIARPVRKKALAFVEAAILSDLIRRDQIEGFETLPSFTGLDDDKVRAILAALITPGGEPVSAAKISAAAGASPTGPAAEEQTRLITSVLEGFRTARGEAYEVWRAPWTDDGGDRLYAPAARQPSLVQQVWRTIRGAIRNLRRTR